MPLENLFFSSLNDATHEEHELVEWDVTCGFCPWRCSQISCAKRKRLSDSRFDRQAAAVYKSPAPAISGCLLQTSHLTDTKREIVFERLSKFSKEKPSCSIVQHENLYTRSWSCWAGTEAHPQVTGRGLMESSYEISSTVLLVPHGPTQPPWLACFTFQSSTATEMVRTLWLGPGREDTTGVLLSMSARSFSKRHHGKVVLPSCCSRKDVSNQSRRFLTLSRVQAISTNNQSVQYLLYGLKYFILYSLWHATLGTLTFYCYCLCVSRLSSRITTSTYGYSHMDDAEGNRRQRSGSIMLLFMDRWSIAGWVSELVSVHSGSLISNSPASQYPI